MYSEFAVLTTINEKSLYILYLKAKLACHPARCLLHNKNIIMSTFKSSRDIQK